MEKRAEIKAAAVGKLCEHSEYALALFGCLYKAGGCTVCVTAVRCESKTAAAVNAFPHQPDGQLYKRFGISYICGRYRHYSLSLHIHKYKGVS